MKRLLPLAVGLLALVATGCLYGDPAHSVNVRNDTDRDFILVWLDVGTNFHDGVLLPAHASGLASQSSGRIDDWTFLLLVPSCDLMSSIRASGDNVNLVVEPSGAGGVLDRTDDRNDSPVVLDRTDRCFVPGA